jgi:hypothetical protein
MMRTFWSWGAPVIAATCLSSRVARAQPAGAEVALAEALYQKGRQLMADGNYAEACPKFAESYRLDPATGTLLNLAACHEGQHKVATAWLELSEALAAAKRDHRDDRVKFAEEHLAAIEPKLSRLTIAVASGAEIPDLNVELDGVVVLAAARGVPAPVDPGEHMVEAKAPGKKPWSQRIVIDERPQSLTITVPSLEDAAPPPVTQPPIAPPPQPLPEASTSRPIPTLVYVAGAATVALTVAGAVTGSIYLAHRSSLGKAQEEPDYSNNKTLGNACTVLFGGALLGAGVTTYFYVTRPSRPNATAITVSPWLGADGGGIRIGGVL